MTLASEDYGSGSVGTDTYCYYCLFYVAADDSFELPRIPAVELYSSDALTLALDKFCRFELVIIGSYCY